MDYKRILLINRPEKNKPIQTVVERYIQLKGCNFVDEIVSYTMEQDLECILKSFKIDVRIVGDEYEFKDFIGKVYCIEKGIDFYYKGRDHCFLSSGYEKKLPEKK